MNAQPVTFSTFARNLCGETAFDVLAVARRLQAQGKDVIELQIGDSPFASTRRASEAGVQAIREHQTHYGPSLGLASFREIVAQNYTREFGVPLTLENVVVGSGAKCFEQFFCEVVLNSGDEVLVFSPHFPTYGPNIERRGARAIFIPLKQQNYFRPDLNAVRDFLQRAVRPKAIFLNSPHNPTGGVATKQDLHDLAELVRGRDVAVFSDEPYCHMAWNDKHHPLLAEQGMMDQVLAAYTFSKSYSMSGWRLGYAVSSPRFIQIVGKMINTSLSCVPPMVQLAGQAALQYDTAERDEAMARFRNKVELLVRALGRIDGVKVLMPAGTFYVFPDVRTICERLGIKSHGLAMYLLEGADEHLGVACLGGECFGVAGQGFLRFSCAEPDERLHQAIAFFGDAVQRVERVQKYLEGNPKYRL